MTGYKHPWEPGVGCCSNREVAVVIIQGSEDAIGTEHPDGVRHRQRTRG